MHQNLDALLTTLDRSDLSGDATAPAGRGRRRFALELDRRGAFLRLGRVEAYVCFEPDRAWSFLRDPGGFDAQIWRLHLIVGRVPDPWPARQPAE